MTTDPYLPARQRMVAQQLLAPGRDIQHRGVLAALGELPREEFLPPAARGEAYADHAVPLGHGQTLSQPYITALMTQWLDPQPGDRVLEVGTGCGYQTAVLSRLGVEVFTMEIVPALAAAARETLTRLGCPNIRYRVGDGSAGWPEAAPFDGILVACAPEHLPAALPAQLREGGRLVVPVGPAHDQQLYCLQKAGGEVIQKAVLPVRFVPMTGAAGR